MWTHTAMVAAASRLIAQRAGLDGAEAFAAGLLHDVGKLVLGVRLGDPYWKLIDDAAEQGASVPAVESAAFGCHHGTVGGWLLQLWRLPPALVDPVALHHEPLDPRFGLDAAAVVGVADRLVNGGEPGHDVGAVIAELEAFAPGLLGVDDWQELHAELAGEQQAVAGMFEG